jgi:phospholipid/cholesterol/gamma-HCH transport system substrate-binding protein
MSPKASGAGRWRRFRASLGRQARGRGKDTIAIALLTLVAIVLTLWVFTQQKASLPSWAPFVGESFAHLSGDFTSAQAVTPGQGQAVDLAGVQVGKVGSVNLEGGHAVVGLEIQPKYLKVIHPDATLLLRPKTNLNDMVVEISPGSAPGQIEDGANFPLSRTEPNVNFEAFLSTLDADTRQYLQLLVAGGAEGIGGRGRQLSGALRRLQPFSHSLAKLNRAVAQRHVALARVIHDFSLLTTELGRHDAQVERFVTASDAALGNFAHRQRSIQESLVEFPATLSVLQAALASSNRFSLAARPALLGLIPQAQALAPAFKAGERFFKQTATPIRDQIRPFSREIRPVLVHTKQGSADLAKTVSGFGESLGAFNSFLNELAYKPKGSRQSLLFYLPWLNHDLNASFNLADGGGPIFRSQAMLSCNGSYLAQALTPLKPYLKTVLQGLRIPSPTELPLIPEDPEMHLLKGTAPHCGPE